MIYKFKNSPERNVGDNMKIRDVFTEKNMPIDFVIGELNGFHGSFVNNKNTKYYFIIQGNAIVRIDDEETEVEEGDFILIPVNSKHSIEGKVKFAIICTPPFDANSEQII